jgi:hypothetical protein
MADRSRALADREKILEAVDELWDDLGRAPTTAEVSRRIGRGYEYTRRNIALLIKDGALTRNAITRGRRPD